MDIDWLTSPPHRPYPRTPRQADLIALADRLAPIAAANAPRHDRDNSFPFDTFDALRGAGYLALTAPEKHGGRGASPLELMLAQERLARGDGAVALASTMHLIQVASLADGTAWPPALRGRLLSEVVQQGALINNLVSEPELGSPSRGGAFATRAVRDGDGWLITGRKTWSTLSPALAYATVPLTLEEPNGSLARATFLVPMSTPGVRIEETWDSMAMRATGSHDVVFANVRVPSDFRLVQPPAGTPSGWNLIGSAVYLGIATAARDYAVTFARQRTPTALGGESIATLQVTQHRIAQIDILLLQARSVLYGTAELWDQHPEWHADLAPQLAAAKYTATNHAIRITDLALRTVGAAGLLRTSPLQRFFRDARAGLGNPPMDDAALTLIGKAALDIH